MDFRCDRAEIKNWEMTDEGYLRFLAPISREGYLNYTDGKGGMRREYVSAKTLRDSAHSFVNKPITIDHPPIPVTAANAKDYAVGWTGNAAKLDDRGVLWLSGTVFDSAAIESIRSGKKRQISCGYGVKTADRGDGTFEQLSREGNHVAAVARGRAGSEIAFKFDSEDEVLTSLDTIDAAEEPSEVLQTKASKQRKKPRMTTVNLDGVSFALADDANAIAAQQHVNAVNTELGKLRSQSASLNDRADSDKETIAELRQKLKDSEATAVKLNSNLDSANSSIATLTTENETLKSDRADSADSKTMTSEEIAEVIVDRMKLWNEALPFLRSDSPDYDPNYELEPIAIMAEVVKVAHPELAEHLDSLDMSEAKTEGFVKGLYASLNAKRFTARKSGKQNVDSLMDEIRKSRQDSIESSPETRLDSQRKKRADRIAANGLGGRK